VTNRWLLHDLVEDTKRFYADRLPQLQLADLKYLGDSHGLGAEVSATNARLVELKAEREPLTSEEAREQALERLSTRSIVDFLLKPRVWQELSASE
jgi:hypothetical protein